MSEQPNPMYVVSPSPHVHSGASVQRIMLDVLIALLPALGVAIWNFGFDAIRLTVVCVATCVFTEAACRSAMRRNIGITDLSAIVTGVLLAFNLPPSLPSWIAVVGSIVAITLAKQVFGGIGYNPFNPALIGRAFLLISFTGPMTTWHPSGLAARWSLRGLRLDAMTTATPLGIVKEAIGQGEALASIDIPSTLDLFIGRQAGCIGEVSGLALLIGAAYLLWRRCISWHIPAAYLGTVIVLATALYTLRPESAMPPAFHLFGGGLMLGALFMATDMVTTPVTRNGMLIFGIGCGLLTMVIRVVTQGAFPEGVSFAILLMNAVTPLINRATRPRAFGERRQT